MNNYLYYIFCLLFFALVGCKSTTKEPPEKYNIKSSTVVMDSGIFGNPRRQFITDSLLFVLDEMDELWFAVFDLKNRKFIRRFGKMGNGPNEIAMPFNIFMYKGNFAFKTMNSNVIATIQIADIINNKDPKVDILEHLKLKMEATVYTNVIPLNIENKFISTGFFLDGKYAILDIKQHTDSVFGTHYIPGVELNQYTFGFIFQSTITHHPTENKVVNIGRFYDQIEIITYDDNVGCKIISNEPEFRPKINHTGNPIRIDRSSKFAFLNSAVTEKFIYLLYSGKTFEKDGMGVGVSNQVHIYDWDLNKKCIYELDQDISSLLVTPDDKLLYSFALLDDVEFVKWELVHH